MNETTRVAWAGLCAAVILPAAGGCGPAYRNTELTVDEPRAGYRFDALDAGPGNSDETFICLTFSGGGTRAAALAYGVLRELHETPAADTPGHLLDEVDVISSVSGGSFTAAGYAVWRDDLFDGRWERDFLKHDIETDLLFRIFTPGNLLLLPLVMLDRIDIAADYFHDTVFQKHTYRDLITSGKRPLVVINATSIASGQRFEFTQDDFDSMGSDLASIPVGDAAAASSAVPIVFSPLRFRYYDNAVSRRAIRDALTREEAGSRHARRQRWAHTLLPPGERFDPSTYRLDEERHQYLYLLDGALADNLGLAHVIHSFQFGHIREGMDRPAGPIRRVVVIVVNAGTRPDSDIESRPSAPGILTMGYKSPTISIDNTTDALLQFARVLFDERSRRVGALYADWVKALRDTCPDAAVPEPPPELDVDTYLIEVRLTDIPDETERDRCLTMPTRLSLPAGDVDLLIDTGRKLLRGHPRFQELLRAMDGKP